MTMLARGIASPRTLYNAIPCELRRRPQWVVWREEARDGKPAKVPYTPGSRRRARSNDPATWTTFVRALAACPPKGRGGVAYAFTAEDGLVGIDLDKCAQGGVLAPWARDLVETFGSYTEWSPSGRGTHIFVRGALPLYGRRRGQIEMYDRARFFTVTGLCIADLPIEACQVELDALHRRLFPPQPQRPVRRVASVTPDDLALIERAQGARNGRKFADLWAGDWSGYPSQSEADLALCALLAFWADGDGARVDRLFRQSGLMRPKWDRRAYADGRTYGRATVQRALR